MNRNNLTTKRITLGGLLPRMCAYTGLVFLCCGCNSLQRPEHSIRASLLKEQTPLGASYDSVWRFAAWQDWSPAAAKPEAKVFQHRKDCASVSVNPDGVTVGAEWIKGFLGRYWHERRRGTRGVSYYVAVDAWWCFDHDRNLIDVVVTKGPDRDPERLRNSIKTPTMP